jgi:UDP-N-acetylglucosamine kinase
MTGRVIEQALKEGYNIVVEGTFRTPETPIKTLNDMQQHGYQTAVYLQTAPSGKTLSAFSGSFSTTKS